jgi:hypothetical protein
VVPAGHVARICGVEMAGAGEPAQHPSAEQLVHCHEIVRCQHGRLGEVDLPVFASGKHPVDHTAVEVDMRVQCGPEALEEAHGPQPAVRAAAAFAQPRFDHA